MLQSGDRARPHVGDHPEPLPAAHPAGRRVRPGDALGRRAIARLGLPCPLRRVRHAAGVTRPHLHADRVEVGRVEGQRPQPRVGVEEPVRAPGRGGQDGGEGVEEVLQDEGGGQARRLDAVVLPGDPAVGGDPLGDRAGVPLERRVCGIGKADGQVRVAVGGDPDPEVGEMATDLGEVETTRLGGCGQRLACA